MKYSLAKLVNSDSFLQNGEKYGKYFQSTEKEKIKVDLKVWKLPGCSDLDVDQLTKV